MPISALGAMDNPAARLDNNSMSAFRDADFLAIMMAELSNQDPFEPMETSKLVENMQKLQELANTRHESFRNDLRWAQELLGQTVTVNQAGLSEEEARNLRDRGLNPDVGFDFVSGRVESYRVVGEQAWIHVNGKDYKIDNVQRINPDRSSDHNLEIANNLLGFFVTFSEDMQGDRGGGLVTDVQWNEAGEVFLTVDNRFVDYNAITSIGLPSNLSSDGDGDDGSGDYTPPDDD
ncbi:MAG: hypothetical protein EA401_03710 [Planctomycetota bacterium]|nr:MAG: hypothetical protein EA401_03710 [Planctomycetota bacterium]